MDIGRWTDIIAELQNDISVYSHCFENSYENVFQDYHLFSFRAECVNSSNPVVVQGILMYLI